MFHKTTPDCKTKTKTTVYNIKTKTKTTACNTKTKTKTNFLVSDRSYPKTDGVRSHCWTDGNLTGALHVLRVPVVTSLNPCHSKTEDGLTFWYRPTHVVVEYHWWLDECRRVVCLSSEYRSQYPPKMTAENINKWYQQILDVSKEIGEKFPCISINQSICQYIQQYAK